MSGDPIAMDLTRATIEVARVRHALRFLADLASNIPDDRELHSVTAEGFYAMIEALMEKAANSCESMKRIERRLDEKLRGQTFWDGMNREAEN